MRQFGQILGYIMPFLLLAGPILYVIAHPLTGAICLGLGLFGLALKVDLLLSRLPAAKDAAPNK